MKKFGFILLAVFLFSCAPVIPQPKHDHWCENGRCLVFEGTNQRVYKSSIGQRNIKDANGNWQPYLWNPVTKIAKFAGGEIRFLGMNPRTVQYWRDGNLIFVSSFHPEVENSGVWSRSIATRSPLVVEEVDTEFNKLLKIHLPFSSANQQDTVTVIVGGGEFANIEISIRAINAGTYRMNFEIQRTRASGTIIQTSVSKLDPTLIDVGRIFSDFKVFWHKTEVAEHSVQGSANTEILLLEGFFNEGEIKGLFPETFGPTAIAADADDGEENRSNVYDNVDGIYGSDELFMENASGSGGTVRWGGFRWDNIDLSGTPTSIDAGTEIAMTNNGSNSSSGNVEVIFAGSDGYDPGQYANSGGNRPSDDTPTTAIQTLTGQDASLTFTVENIVEEWVETDGNSYTGSQAMRFFGDEPTGNTGHWWGWAEDYDGAGDQVETTLTIVYTASGGVTRRRPLFR